MTDWDAARYDRSFGYVSDHGRALLALLAVAPGERVLDLGCGTGDLAGLLAAAGAEVTGIDSDPAMISTARAKHPHVRFEHADAHRFRLDEPVDAVVSNAALHWMLDPSAVLDRVRATLRPGGRFIGEFGGEGNVATIRRALDDATIAAGIDPAILPDPWFFPDPARWGGMLEQRGFRVVCLERFDRPTPLDDCPNGVVDWLEMFGATLLSGLPDDRREHVVRDAADRCRPLLYRDGRWYADYVRLRFHAVQAVHG